MDSALPPTRLLAELGQAVEDHIQGLSQWLDAAASSLLMPPSAPKLGALRPGDTVHVWSNSTNRWITDGVVKEVATTVLRVDPNQVLPVGSVRVSFDSGAGNKWVLPQQIPHILRVGVPSAVATAAAAGGERQAVQRVPTPQKARRAAAAPAAPSPLSMSADPLVAGLSSLRALEARCEAKNRAFEDPEFPPQLHGKVKRWCRPAEVTAQAGRPLGGWAYELFGITTPADWHLFRGAPRADDVQQGELGDCWFISSLSALAEYQNGKHVRMLLPSQERVSPAGAYMVRLCLGGRWRGILVDDRLPCLKDEKSAFCTQLAYCEAHRLQLWASIVEKGLAKACGSYAALHRGQAAEALSILTGWPSTQISFDRPNFQPALLWASLLSAKQMGFLLACGTYKTRSSNLQPYHIYTLLDLFEVASEDPSHPHRVLKIRNPHAESMWSGDWSDASPLWTPVLRERLGCPEGGTPGVFFISLKDFLKNFAHCTICKIRSNGWHEQRRPVQLLPKKMPQACITFWAAETAECCVTLAQPEERLRKGPLYRDQSLPLATIGFALLENSSVPPKLLAKAKLKQRALVSVECRVTAGHSYTLVPLIGSGKSPVDACVAFLSSRPLGELQEMSPGPGHLDIAMRTVLGRTLSAPPRPQQQQPPPPRRQPIFQFGGCWAPEVGEQVEELEHHAEVPVS